MNRITKEFVSFAKAKLVLEQMPGSSFRAIDGFKNDFYTWFEDNLNEIVKLESTSPELTNEEVQVGINHGKIECVKAVRNRTNMSLLDSKNCVEKYFEKYGYKFGTYSPRY